jgi:hypothetical protein
LARNWMLLALLVLAMLTLTLIILLDMDGIPPLPNATAVPLGLEFSIEERMDNLDLRLHLLGEDSQGVAGASGYVEILGRAVPLAEEGGAYLARLVNVSAGTHIASVKMSKAGYTIPAAQFELRVKFERVAEGAEQPLGFSRLEFNTDRPQVCASRIMPTAGVNVSVLYDGSRNPLVRFEFAFPQPLDLSTFHYVRLNFSLQKCPDLSIGLVDQSGSSFWHTLSIPEESYLEWDFNDHEEELLRTSWDGLWGGLVPRNLGADWIDFSRVSKIMFRTSQRRDGANQSIAINEIAFVREPVLISVCPPTLRQAINLTLAARADPLFIDEPTGLPYEFINLRDGTLPASSDLDFTIGNNEIGEGLTSFWMYYFASGEKWVGDFLQRTAKGMATYLDPGSGLIGLHHYDRRTRELETDTHSLGVCDYHGGPAGESSAQHGGEEPMYMMLPAAWYFGDEEALAALERFSKTMLELNSDPRFPHLHVYVKRCDGAWSVGDWNGKYGDEKEIVEGDPEAYADLSEFWWVTPMMGTAMLTEDEDLRGAIIERCRLVIDNVIQHQGSDGRIPYVFRLDGSQAKHDQTALGWSGYNLNSFFARSTYMLHNLTGEERYLDALERMYDYFLDGRIPEMSTFASQVVFHGFYTGNTSHADRLAEFVKSKYDLEEIQDSIWDCIWPLFHWIWTGELDYLRLALEGESRFRSANWFPIPYGSANHHYYPLSVAQTIIDWGWCPLDKFGSGVEEFYALSQLGSRTKGLIGRDLLILGMMADIPEWGP